MGAAVAGLRQRRRLLRSHAPRRPRLSVGDRTLAGAFTLQLSSVREQGHPNRHDLLRCRRMGCIFGTRSARSPSARASRLTAGQPRERLLRHIRTRGAELLQMPTVRRSQALDLRLQRFLSGADLSLPLAVDTSARLVSPLARRMHP